MSKQRLHTWRCASFYFRQKRPLVMGILNITPDSFSDGGRYLDTSGALLHAHHMLDLGADIIEVGGESTRPGSCELAPKEELKRILPTVKTLSQEGVCVAIDSRHPEVIETCLEHGAAIINDIKGFRDSQMRTLAAQSKAGCVIMHMQGVPQTMQENPQYTDVVSEVGAFLLGQAQLLTQAGTGVAGERICLDPGPGFGKTFEQNRALLQSTAHLSLLGVPPFILMAAWSRKRFIGEITGQALPSKRVAGSVAAALYAAERGAGVLRVHDVGPTVEALAVLDALNA